MCGPTPIREGRYLQHVVTEIARSQHSSSLLEASTSRSLVLQPGEVLINQDAVTDSVYILVDGALEVARSLDEGSAVLAVIDQPGTVIGEIVAMGGGTRTATVTAAARTEVIEVSAEEFQDQLRKDPDLADDLVAMAVRRVEQVELAEILSRHFNVVDQASLSSTCDRVEWRRLSHGETLFEEGDLSDSVYIVVKGRLAAHAHDPDAGHETKIGELGRGDVVGEVGLLGHAPRGASVVAIRDSVVARLDEPTFLALIEAHPRMMIDVALRAVERARETRWHSSPNTVLAVVGCRRIPVGNLVDLMEAELQRLGTVHRLSPELVDATLATPGISDAARGEVGDVRVSRMVHELELDADHLLVEVGQSPGAWSSRALGLADRVVIVVPNDITPNEAGELDNLLGACPVGVERVVVVQRPSGAAKPAGSALVRERFGASGVFNIASGSGADASRLARIAVGRGNALVMSGGGGRGFAHIGVYRALSELGFPIDIVGGTSIGGVIACVIADAMSPDEILEWARRHFPRALDYTIPVVSLTKGDRIAQSALSTFGDRGIEDLWRTCFAVSTDLTSSRLHVHDSGSVAVAIRATSAIPGVMPPVPHGDSLLIDGGVLNNLPIDVARAKTPAGKVVAIDVAPPRGPGAHGDFGLSVSGWNALRSSMRGTRSPYPKISAVLMRSMITASMLERDSQVSRGLADLYLDLDMRGVSMLEFGDPAGVADRGYEAAMPDLENWLRQLEASSEVE